MSEPRDNGCDLMNVQPPTAPKTLIISQQSRRKKISCEEEQIIIVKCKAWVNDDSFRHKGGALHSTPYVRLWMAQE
uniref:Uncharacterized protein n=1 Tax=Romanomermis culicivorax TaxID=13658 RepID=A0A915I5B6_ROMCU